MVCSVDGVPVGWCAWCMAFSVNSVLNGSRRPPIGEFIVRTLAYLYSIEKWLPNETFMPHANSLLYAAVCTRSAAAGSSYLHFEPISNFERQQSGAL